MKNIDLPFDIVKISPSVVQIIEQDTGLSLYYDNESLAISFDAPPPTEHHSLPLTDLPLGNPFPDSAIRKRLSRLTINVTKSCNLRCEYCYAEYGKYGSAAKEHELDDFLNVLESLTSHYHTIDRVQFFGGEPLLAKTKIIATILFFEKSAQLGVLKNLPKFSVVTNGTLLHKKDILEILSQHNFQVTVSIDGPKEITNILRPTASRRSLDTYEQIQRGISAAIDVGLEVATEGTFTRKHQDLGITPLDVIDHINFAYGLGAVHIAPAAFSEWGDQRPNEHQAAAEFYNAAYTSGHRIVTNSGPVLDMSISVVSQLAQRKRSQEYCPAFTSQLSIDASGYVFPCFMSMSASETNLGHLANDIWPTEKSLSLHSAYSEQMKNGALGTRHAIWFDSLITGCAAADYLANKIYGKDSDCLIHEAIIAGTLLGVTQGSRGTLPH